MSGERSARFRPVRPARPGVLEQRLQRVQRPPRIAPWTPARPPARSRPPLPTHVPSGSTSSAACAASAAARSRQRRSSASANSATRAIAGLPRVSVPVLSSTTSLARSSASSARERVSGAPREVVAESLSGAVTVDAKTRLARIHAAAGFVTLRGGGEMSFDRALITKIAPDEVPYSEGTTAETTEAVVPVVASRGLVSKTAFDPIIERAATRHDVDTRIVKAVIQVESAFQPRARSSKGAMGLIINWESTVPIARALREFQEAKGRKDRVFVGGPVQRSGVQALLRSKTKPDDARHVFEDVYLISTMELLRKTLADTEHPDSLRVYIGYSGWGAGQLDNELSLGTWHVTDGDAGTVFDPEPQSVWQRMIERSQLRFAFDPAASAVTLPSR